MVGTYQATSSLRNTVTDLHIRGLKCCALSSRRLINSARCGRLHPPQLLPHFRVLSNRCVSQPRRSRVAFCSVRLFCEGVVVCLKDAYLWYFHDGKPLAPKGIGILSRRSAVRINVSIGIRASCDIDGQLSYSFLVWPNLGRPHLTLLHSLRIGRTIASMTPPTGRKYAVLVLFRYRAGFRLYIAVLRSARFARPLGIFKKSRAPYYP